MKVFLAPRRRLHFQASQLPPSSLLSLSNLHHNRCLKHTHVGEEEEEQSRQAVASSSSPSPLSLSLCSFTTAEREGRSELLSSLLPSSCSHPVCEGGSSQQSQLLSPPLFSPRRFATRHLPMRATGNGSRKGAQEGERR